MMRSYTATLAILVAIFAAPLRGEVIESSAAGFLVRNTAAINAPPAKVYTAITDRVGGWWDPAHTFSNDARNLSVDAKPGGCFCERLPDGGGVQHMSVVYASPGKLLRLTGAIGPLQEAALAATMTWNLTQAGGGTTVEVSYTVGGFRAGGFRDLPTVVDGVLRGQLARLKAFVETGHPDGGSR
ncbi:MAG TPA: SRPBCC domain-containing protein [Vicinamibacterales bacterium]|nr:SRPBCC domain-containing protein [Vicinamibacterales bacterium]